MRRAIDLSRERMREENAAPFAAVIVRNGEIVGQGWNRALQDFDPTAHGEVVAIRDACRNLETLDLSECELYTSCEPCPLCVSAMYYAGIRRMYYAASLEQSAQIAPYPDSRFLCEELNRPVRQRAIPAEQVMADEAVAVLLEWRDRPEFLSHFPLDQGQAD
jgi:tRNA(Arg) A34 adenosine deaminase TadA